MSIGMTYEEFWQGETILTRYYLKAFKLKEKREAEKTKWTIWEQGMYIYGALCYVSPILHAFSKNGTKPLPYTEKPFLHNEETLMSEEEKSQAQILDLSYDFSCRIIRLYKYLNEGKLSKADRDIIDAVGRQLLRSATSINANMNEAQHPQSDADFLSKASIALKEARESENWLSLLRDNGFLEPRASESLMNDCSRINKVLITITAKVRKRLSGGKD